MKSVDGFSRNELVEKLNSVPADVVADEAEPRGFRFPLHSSPQRVLSGIRHRIGFV
jgi:hypothetical protein